jgi:hypothetical protein
VKALALARAAELKRKERALHQMRRSLEHLAASCHGDDRPECPIIGDLEGVGNQRTAPTVRRIRVEVGG